MEYRKELHVKNMVCNRCIKVISDELKKLGIEFEKIDLGLVHLKEHPDNQKITELKKILIHNGFELIDNTKSRIIEKIKTEIIKLVHNPVDIEMRTNLSDYLASKVGYEYTYISNLFSSIEGKTIENYFIQLKIEKAKELLVYGELTLTEVSYQLGYKSVQHLSNQFKRITGLNPSHFKKIKDLKRTPIDEI